MCVESPHAGVNSPQVGVNSPHYTGEFTYQGMKNSAWRRLSKGGMTSEPERCWYAPSATSARISSNAAARYLSI
eukprot:864610-Pyramimonas_sp.AAC.1